jgi:ribosomal protein S18 acetylase RimI-like enzyme
MTYLATPLSQNHNRKNFNCGEFLLDNYIKTQVNQDIRKRLAACFVLVDNDDKMIGYYTLSNISIPASDVPEHMKGKIPRDYTDVPATLLGRLAVDSNSKGRGIGEKLLIDALKRSCYVSKTVASYAVLVDTIDQKAIDSYKKYGFTPLDSGKMFIAMKTIEALLSN